MLVLKRSLVEDHPDFPCTMMSLLAQSAGSELSEADRRAHPCGISRVRPHLEFAIDMVHRQGLISERPALESLFHATTLID